MYGNAAEVFCCLHLMMLRCATIKVLKNKWKLIADKWSLVIYSLTKINMWDFLSLNVTKNFEDVCTYS